MPPEEQIPGEQLHPGRPVLVVIMDAQRNARQAQAMADIPAKRFGTPAEFGQTCAFLCSVHAAYITGQNILLDGGAYPAAF